MRCFICFLVFVAALGCGLGMAQEAGEAEIPVRQTIFETCGGSGEVVRFECVLDTADVYFDELGGFGYVLLRNGEPLAFINMAIYGEEGEDVDDDEEETGEDSEADDQVETDDDDYGVWALDESKWSPITPIYYFASPDSRYLYVTHKPSLAGSCDRLFKIHLYRIDCFTGEVTWLVNCGGLRLVDDGFCVLRQVDVLNPDASCAEARYTACEVFYDWSGERVRRDPVQLLEEFVDSYDLWYGEDIGDDEACSRFIHGESIATF